jgi:hypothetical protein
MKKKLVSMLLVSCMSIAMLAGCGNTLEAPVTPETGDPTAVAQPGVGGGDGETVEVDPLAFTPGTELRMATGYNSAATGLVFDSETIAKANKVSVDEDAIRSQMEADGKTPIPKIKEQVTTTKHVAPDTGAIIFVLTNGDPDHWKNRQNAELTGANGEPLVKPARVLTKKEAKEFMKQLEDEV